MNIPDYVLPIIGVIVAAGCLLAAALATTAIEAFFERARSRHKAPDNSTPEVDQTEIRSGADVLQGVPDYVAPIVAYRAWQWDGFFHLKSLNGEAWYPGQPLRAQCTSHGHRALDVPEKRCTCGVYAAKTLDQLRTIGYASFGIYGEVYLWGTVVEHACGWRAQFAYPKSIVVPFEMIPAGLLEGQSWVQGLVSYGADIFIDDGKQQIPLWTKVMGYDSAGLDYVRKVAIGEVVASVPIAFLTEDPRQHVLLQNGVEAKHAAEIVFTDFSLNGLAPVIAQMRDPRIKVIVIDLRPENVRLSNYVADLVLFASRDRDIAIFVRSDRYTGLNLTSGMGIRADAYLTRKGRYDVQPAYKRFIKKSTKACPTSRSVRPDGSSGPPRLTPPPPIPVHTVSDLSRISRCAHHRWPEHWTLATAV